MGHAVESNEASKQVAAAETSNQTAAAQEILASRVQEALSEILISSPFRSSKQSQELLRYIVDKSLAGHAELLKERIIGIEVFGRRPDYDTNADPIGRARVAEVRKRLALYYQSEQGKEIQISIPVGCFKASFEWSEKHQDLPPSASSHELEPGPAPAEHMPPQIPHEIVGHDNRRSSAGIRSRVWWIVAVTSIAILVVTIQYFLPSSKSRAFNHFWSPILDNPNPALIYIGSNAVYQLSPSYLEAYYQKNHKSPTDEMGLESFIQWPPGTKIDTDDLIPAKNTFVTIGDVAAITKIASLLVRRNRRFDIRYGTDVSYGDLIENPTVLIGAHNNSWTLKMTNDLHYVFSGPNAIVDRSDTSKRWSANASFTDDYAIISRVIDSKSGATLIAVAGIGFAGTEAAAEFVTNPQSISMLAKSLPKGWEKRNLQVVLHTSVRNQVPSAANVVAIYCGR